MLFAEYIFSQIWIANYRKVKAEVGIPVEDFFYCNFTNLIAWKEYLVLVLFKN